MKKCSTINLDSKNNKQRTFSINFDNSELNLNKSKCKTSRKDFVITSIIGELTTMNKILGINEKEYNEKIFILTINGKISFSYISWKIYKTPKQIQELFQDIKKEISKKDIILNEAQRVFKLVKSYSVKNIINNINKITDYIKYMYNETKVRESETLNEALRISAISFSNNDGIKPFEGYGFKKAEPRMLRQVMKILISPLEYLIFKQWNKRWLVLKDDMICYLNNPNLLIGKNAYWFDENIEIQREEDLILEVRNLSINLVLKFDSKFERDLWYIEINKRIEKKRDAIFSNIYHSFTTQKSNCRAKWFIDGEDYFLYLLNQLKNANESVYITDWFLSPPVALKRPINYEQFLDEKNDYKKNLTFDNASRLMDILLLLAKRGVKIFILLFYEISIALPLNSLYAKTTLKELHPNIKITRHPKGSSSILWSHHEKLVIIDQTIAFVGGLDLGWGRYDTNKHPIVEEERADKLYYYPGADYMSERTSEMRKVDKFNEEQIDRNIYPRMGWHDIQTMVEGPIVSDIVRHFVERWNFARSVKRNNQLVDVGISVWSKRGYTQKIPLPKKMEQMKNLIHKEDNNNFTIQKNLTFQVKDFDNICNEIHNNLDEDEKEIKNNKSKKNKEKKDNIINLYDEDDNDEFSFDNANIINRDTIKDNNDEDKNENHYGLKYLKEKIKHKYGDYKTKYNLQKKSMKIKQKVFLNEEDIKDDSMPSNFKIQALRSGCSWSIGLANTERSILEAYYKLIDNSKHYIYIENQFFISKPFSEDERNASGLNLQKLVQNEIALHIRNRIEKAHENKQNFKVFICIPLLPSFPGEPNENNTLDAVLKHTLKTIGNNKGMSLIELLRKKIGKDVDKYIYFFSLRNHGVLKGKPVTELIYIHSKLLIIDDEKVLIGSANINDRSMLGTRDSEFAVIMEEEKNYKSIMDNKPFYGSNYAISLRKALFAEHLNLDIKDNILDDPLNERFWKLMKAKALNNTFIYDKVFDCFPNNKFTNFKLLKERRKFETEKEIEELKLLYKQHIKNIDGHIVEYPYQFLIDEELNIDFFSKENLVPEKNFL